MEHSSTPDSERTLRPEVPAFTPLRKNRLYELGEQGSAFTVLHQTRSSPTSTQKTASSNTNEDDDSQSRPSITTTSVPDETAAGHHYAARSTFVPPESPDLLSPTRHFKSLGPDLSELKPTTPVDNYRGVTLRPDQVENLTMVGALGRLNQNTAFANGTGDSNSSTENQTNTTFTPSSARFKSLGTSVSSTPSKMKFSNHTSFESEGSVNCIDSPTKPQRFHVPPQTKTFAQLAEGKGVRPWNALVLDDRWRLDTGEMNQTAGRRAPVLSASPDSLLDGSTPYENGYHQKIQRPVPTSNHPWNVVEPRHHVKQAFEQHSSTSSDDLAQEGGVRLDNGISDQRQPSSVWPPSQQVQRYVPLPLEFGRLDQLVADLQSGVVTMEKPCCDRLTKFFIFNRVFGNWQGPEPLDEDEAGKIAVHDGKPKTLAELRHEILDTIDDLTAFCQSPAGKELRERSDSVKQLRDNAPALLPFPDRSLTQDILNHRHLANGLGRLGIAEPRSQVERFSQQENHGHQNHYALTDSQQLYEEVSQSSNAGYRSPSKHQVGASQFALLRQQTYAPAVSDRAQRDHPGETSTLRRSNNGGQCTYPFDLEQQSRYATERSADYTPGEASNHAGYSTLPPTPQPQWNSIDGSNDNTPLASQSLQHQGHMVQQMPTQAFNNLTPAQFNFLVAQQMHQMQMMHAAQGLPFGYRQPPPQPPAGDTYGTNGLFVPNDRLVRPPATNRLAPLFARDGAYGANRQQTATPQLPEWQNRFGSPFVPRDTRKLAYVEGSEDMYPQPSFGGGASVRYQNLTRSQPPDYATVTHDSNIPFVETARASKPAEWGVLKLGNIPYDLTKASVIQFLGNHAKIITPELGPSIHIIMDRATGKTQDCYVEFFSTPDARSWEKTIKGRGMGSNRIGDRLIDVSLSSQDVLLKELFPRAKSVMWEGGYPVILAPEEPFNTGFKSFISAEELQILVRHAEQPQRSNYTMKCQNRPYEAMISLLSKFPWQATSHYTIATRNKIFDAAAKMLEILSREIRRNGGTSSRHALPPFPTSSLVPYGADSAYGANYPPLSRGPLGSAHHKPLNTNLLRDLLSAALNAAGFSDRQRWELYHTVGSDLDVRQAFLISPLAQYWPFECVGRKRGMEEDVVEWYAKLLGEHPEVQALGPGRESPFGNLVELFVRVRDSETMDMVGMQEWNTMGRIVAEQCNAAEQARLAITMGGE